MGKPYKQLQRDGKISNFVDGLYMQNGREKNARPDGMTGIAQAAMYRQQMKKQYKIDCIADGIERAKMRMDGDKDIYEF
jgi:hypothetical protein|tara:strand:- start:139 stop:375 length:237 start_codon:yes stop_codon:yes gene_type:complete